LAAATGQRAARADAKLGPPIERVGALAGFSLDVLGNDLQPLGFSKAMKGRALRLDAKP
jgi:hypothetical protein